MNERKKVSNADIEMRWIDAWSNLAEIVGKRLDVRCLLPDGSIVDAETCRAWLQDSVYAGFVVRVVAGWVEGREGVIASRSDGKLPAAD